MPFQGRSNEIPGLPRLLKFLDLKGYIVTADAMGCQNETAAKGVEAGVDYVLALSGNHGLLRAKVAEYLDDPIVEGWKSKMTGQRARGPVMRPPTSPRCCGGLSISSRSKNNSSAGR